jgi:hypothetical protein
MVASQSNPVLALFLGAGFSKHWGLPLAREVMDTNDLSSMRFPRRRQYQLLKRVEAYWKATSEQHNNVVDNFARLLQSPPPKDLSYEEFVQFLGLRFSMYHWRIGESRRTVGGVGDHIRKKRDIPAGYESFVRAFQGQRIAGIVTTNYDIVVEKLLGPHIRGRLGGFNYGEPDEPLQARHYTSSQWSYGPIRVTGRIPLLKLHGSLNWALSPTQELVKYIDARPSRLQGYRPVLLPPGLSDVSDALVGVWEHASRVLSAANIWVFCGYSMPPYDADVVNLLRSSAAIQLKRVVVLAPDPTSIMSRIEEALGMKDATPARIQYVTGPGVDDTLDSTQITSLLEFR